MGIHIDTGKLAVRLLGRHLHLTKRDIGKDAVIRKKGIKLSVEVYDIEEAGRLCILRIKAPLSIMKAETVIISSNKKDIPLFNADWFSVFGKETQICELYDIQTSPYPQEKLDEFERIKERDSSIKDTETKPHWYDEILLPCSYHKKGGSSERFTDAVFAYLSTYLRQLPEAEECDPVAKQEKITGFAERLLSEEGPAASFIKSAVGDELAEKIIVGYMYGNI